MYTRCDAISCTYAQLMQRFAIGFRVFASVSFDIVGA